jgi:hypothetical protein
MDLLAIAIADPTVLPLWGAFLFAVGMWPVGMFFGCNTCCDPCTACTQGSLPETITVSFSGFSDEQVPGPDLISLEFSSCYGSGAEARVTAPGGNADTDKGPISSVQVTKGGSGYAKIGRVAPTVTVSGTSGSGTGATFAVTLASSQDSCGLDRWAVSKVTLTGGTGYANGDTLTFALANGDTQEVAAAAKIADLIYAEPTLSLSVAGGTGAVLQIDGYTKSGDNWGLVPSDTWRISGITVANGGSGYTNNTLVTVNLGQGDEARPGAGSNLRVRTAIVEPTGEGWTLEAHDGSYNPSAGAGLALSFTLARLPPNGWEVTAATVTSGGSGYAAGEIVDAYPASRSTPGAWLEITSVDQNGDVTGISIVNVVEIEGTDSGVIESVSNLFSQAGWRKVITNPDGVRVTNGGVYYREDASAPAYVSPVTVTVTQSLPSAGTGASLSVEIDDDPASETFGQITGVNIDNGGDGYLAWQYRPVACCEDYWNGKSFVLRRVGGCTYQHVVCGTQCGETITVVYRGPSLPPVVDVGGLIAFYVNGSPIVAPHASACYQSLDGTSLVANCSNFSFTATNESGVTATVTAGGTYDPEDQSDNGTGRCHTCCRGEEDPPEEIEVEVADGHPIPGQPGSIGWFAPGLLGPNDYPLPIFVLRRGWQYINPPQSGGSGCQAVWSASVPVVGGGATDLYNYDLSVTVSTCSNPSVVDCDHCWKKCETTAFVQTFFNCYGTSARDRGGSEGCLNCTESPMCGPAAGEYFITKNIFGDPLCNIPGGVRVRVL